MNEDSSNGDEERAAPSGGSFRSAPQPVPLTVASAPAVPVPADIARVLGLLTHDLRNPLAALSSNIGFLQMVSDELSDETREAVDDLVLSVEALGRITDSLEVFSNELSGRAPQEASAVPMSSVLRSVKGHVERGAVSHGVTMRWEFADCEERRVHAVETALVFALSSLLHNALTSAPARSVVTLRLTVQGEILSCTVEDDGPALSPILRSQVLSALSQVENKGERSARYSRGLGLYAVARGAALARVELVFIEREKGSALALNVPLAQ